jgi:DNA topoisomerase VI subunit B
MTGAIATVEQAKSVPAERAVFTNCGKAKQKETRIKSAQSTKKKLTRVPFTVSRLMEFCNTRELINQTGHDVYDWPLVVLKELTDNALDACEEAGISPEIEVAVDGDKIIIADNGPGLPAGTIKSVLDYTVRVSSREAYCSPTRGAQGNALKTILPMGYVLDERHGEDASGVTVIEAHGVAHHIRFSVDHIRQEPKIEHTTQPSAVLRGTRITVQLLNLESGSGWVRQIRHEKFLRLAESYPWLNPHLGFKVTWNGKTEINVRASNPTWAKWLPSWPTSPHWYDKSRFRRYMAAHIAHRGDITVREFVSEFDGLTATTKQKEVLLETGASHVSLHEFFGRHKTNTDNIARLLAALRKHSRPVKPAHLGIIGKAHLYHMMEAAGGDRNTFTYNRRLGEDGNGLPRVIEFAFGVHREGLTETGVALRGKCVTGVNWSPGINNPFRQIGRDGKSLDAVLERARASTSQPVISMLHLACPRVQYTDRGKSAIAVEGEPDGDDEE